MTKCLPFILAILSLSLSACATPLPEITPLPDDIDHPPVAEQVHHITLLTGDRITYTRLPSGRVAVEVEAANRATGYPVSFISEERTPDPEADPGDAEFWHYPSDISGYLHAGVLDREIFNLSRLVEQGFDEARGGLPLIIVYKDDVAVADIARAAGALPGSRYQRTLSSINAAAVEVDPAGAVQFWAAITAESDGRSFNAAIERVVLDRIMYTALDESVPIVGAPVAWAAGYTGHGIDIAIVDTGIDPDHPDFFGRIAAEANFTTSDTTSDRHGHGTHVAGIAAGSGAASAGQYVGVAFDAQLLNAKVIGDTGTGQASWVIAGMEWAAEQGADVINVSISDDTPGDGTDPVSQAVNQLVAQHDVLFVVSAGNEGLLGDHTITAPGAADAALTVGSVNKAGQLAGTSSVGPRLGDFAIKPDMTAPGVDIVSARADGSELGTPVGDDYMQLSGTSMAAPHVAGAAAILLQQRPALTPVQLKAALATTAVPNDSLDVYQQGGGRLDVASLIDVPILAEPAPLDLGFFEYPHEDTDPVTLDVTYTNWSSDDVTLELKLAVASRDGIIPDETMLWVYPDQLTLEPGQSDWVEVTLDVSQGEPGLYGGYLVASKDGQAVTRTPIGFNMESERFLITVKGIRRDGRLAAGPGSNSVFRVINVDDATIFMTENLRFIDGIGQVFVPPGHYSITGVINSYDPDLEDFGLFIPLEWVLIAKPEVEVTSDVTITLDARMANEITFETPEETERIDHFFRMTWWRESEQGGGISTGISGIVDLSNHPAGTLRRFSSETTLVERGSAELLVDSRLAIVEAGIASPILYDLVVFWRDHIPFDLTYTVDIEEMASVVNYLHSSGGLSNDVMRENRRFWRPWQTSFFSPPPSGRLIQNKLKRKEFLVPGDTRYQQIVDASGENATGGPGRMDEPETSYTPGERREQTWFKAPMRPGVREIGPGAAPVVRADNTLFLMLPEWVDAHPGHFGFRHTSVDTTAFRLFRDGQLIAQAPRAQGEFSMVPQHARYRMELDVDRDAPWQSTSIRTRTAWSFHSQDRPGIDTELLPIILLDYDMDLDLDNSAIGDHMEVTARYQAGVAGPPINNMRLWVARDDGVNWRELTGKALGDGRFRFPVGAIHQGSEFVSLRVEAWDRGNNRIEQEIIRAYIVPPEHL